LSAPLGSLPSITARSITSHALCHPIFLPIGVLTDGCVSDPAMAGLLDDDWLAAHKQHFPQIA